MTSVVQKKSAQKVKKKEKKEISDSSWLLCFAKGELIYHRFCSVFCGCIVTVPNTNTSSLSLGCFDFDLIYSLDLEIAAVCCNVCIHCVVRL